MLLHHLVPSLGVFSFAWKEHFSDAMGDIVSTCFHKVNHTERQKMDLDLQGRHREVEGLVPKKCAPR
jgi:hypothetical protein